MTDRSPARVALVQMCSTEDVAANLRAAAESAARAADAGAATVMLPEAFAYLGRPAGRIAVAEPLDAGADGPILAACRGIAREHEVHLLAGGFPEACDERHTFNTALHIDPAGQLRARYRKLHLFDVDLADGTSLRESSNTAAGDALVTTDLPCGTTGMTICYDMRFPQLYQRLVDAGATVLTAPSAFTTSTGAAHWHLLLRARAVECQAFMLAAAQTGEHGGGRSSYGHSLAVDPWGRVLLDMEDRLGVGLVDLDPDAVDAVRARLPSLRHRRPLPPEDAA